MEIVIWLILGLVVGGVVGALATWWISRARGGAVSVMQLKQENDKFRNEVTEHFVETARLINQMTDSYKQVFDHLSSGAEKLVDEKSLAERLPPASGQEVKLSQFGASVASEKDAGESGKTGSGGSASGDARTSGAGTSGASGRSSGNADPLKRGSSQSGSVSSSGPAASEKSKTDPGAGSKSGDGERDKPSKRGENAGERAGASSAKATPGSSQPGAESRGKD